MQYNSLPKLDNNNYYGRKYPGPKGMDGVEHVNFVCRLLFGTIRPVLTPVPSYLLYIGLYV